MTARATLRGVPLGARASCARGATRDECGSSGGSREPRTHLLEAHRSARPTLGRVEPRALARTTLTRVRPADTKLSVREVDDDAIFVGE